jgi:site-specific DNA-adenine methylase
LHDGCIILLVRNIKRTTIKLKTLNNKCPLEELLLCAALVAEVSLYKDLFEGWEFKNSSFQDAIALAADKYFVYVDPPYDNGFTGYSGLFVWDEQVS